jgi:hypothetical protein
MPADFLAINYRSGVTPAVIHYSGSTIGNVGTNFGVLDTGTGDGNVPFNRVIKFFGQKGLTSFPFQPAEAVFEAFYAVAGSTVYRSFDDGANWEVVFALTPISASTTIKKSGLNIIYMNGLPALTIFWRDDTGGNWYGAYTFDGVNWTRQGGFSVTSGNPGSGLTSDTVYQNVIYCTSMPINQGVVYYNPAANIIGQIGLNNSSGAGCGCICEYNNRLFILYTRTTNSDSNLYEIIGGAAFPITDGINGIGNASTGNMCALFADRAERTPDLYGIFHGSTGFVAYRWTSSLGTPTNITSSVLPTALSTIANTARAVVLVDDVDITAHPRVYIYAAPSGLSTAQWSIYEWEGPSIVMSLVPGSVLTGSAAHAIPANRTSAGPYFWNLASSYVIITNREYLTTGGIRLTMRLYASSPTNAFRAFFAIAGEEYPIRPCTLSNPISGTVVGGTLVLNMNRGTPSGTYFQVTWLAQDDGLVNGDQFKLVCENFLL